MVNKVHKVFILTLIILLMSSFASAGWFSYSNSNDNSNINVFGDGNFLFNSTDVFVNKTTDLNYLSTFKPVSNDFDGDGLEDIFVYDSVTGTINVLNLREDNQLLLMDSYTFTQISEGVIAGDENGDLVYYAKSGSDFIGLRYEEGALSVYKTVADTQSMNSKLKCAVQGITNEPYCYYVDSSNYFRMWNISDNTVTVATSTVGTALDWVLTDLDGDAVKDLYTYSGTSLYKTEGLNVSNRTSRTFGTTPTYGVGGIVGIGQGIGVVYDGKRDVNFRSAYFDIVDGTLSTTYTDKFLDGLAGSEQFPNRKIGVANVDGVQSYVISAESGNGLRKRMEVKSSVGTDLYGRNEYIADVGNPKGFLLDGTGYSTSWIAGTTLRTFDGLTYETYTFPETLTSNYIVSDFDGDGYNSIMEATGVGLNIYSSTAVTPTPPSGLTIAFVSGNDYKGFYNFFGEGKTCVGSTITFQANRCLTSSTSSECSYTYDGNQRQRAVANVNGNLIYGDWTYQAGDFTLDVPVTFTLAGSYNVVLYVQSEDNQQDFSKSTSQFIMTVSGEQAGINCNVGSNFLNTPQKSDGSKYSNEGLDGIFDILLGGNTKTKMIIGIGLTLGILIAVAGVTTNWLVLLLTFIMAIIMNTMFGLFPAWIIVLIILIAILIMVFKGTLSKGNGEE